MASDSINNLQRKLYVLYDENNPESSKLDGVYPLTILDQVFDDLSPTNKTLREIIEELKKEIIIGGKGSTIIFPVTSVNGMTDDVVITKSDLGLDRVDNTNDNEKPLSIPQRETVMSMIEGYNFEVDLSDLYNHIRDTNNPHKITFDMLKKDDNFERLLENLITAHNTSTKSNIHADIRRSVATLWSLFDTINDTIDERTLGAIDTLNEHIGSNLSHNDLFILKEDINNKENCMLLENRINDILYPTTNAVDEYITYRLEMFNKTLPPLKDWIQSIDIIDIRQKLPIPSESHHRDIVLIHNGENSYMDMAKCVYDDIRKQYVWNIESLGLYTKYDEEYFRNSPIGLTINIDPLVKSVLNEKIVSRNISEVVREALPLFLEENYYSKEDIDNKRFVSKFNIIDGTTTGTIRYYVNDDMSTMSSDISVGSLQRLAFLEYVTENELYDNSVHSRHILNKAIDNRHIRDKAITVNNIKCPYGYVLGNINNFNDTAELISLQDLANLINNM